MRPRGRNAARVRPADLLEDLDAADASQGNAMGVGPPHRVACRIAGIEPAAAGIGAQDHQQIRVLSADAEIAVGQIETNVEKDCLPVGRTDGVLIRPSSVRTLRPAMIESFCGRQSARPWLHRCGFGLRAS